MKKILIMGANGYIGSCLTKRLCDRDDQYEVIASGRNNNNIDTRAKYIKYDIKQGFSEGEQTFFPFDIPDICIYLTWQDGFNHNADSHMRDLSYHWRFIKRLLDGGIRHLAVMGSFREYGNYCGAAREDMEIQPDNFYVLAKDTLHKAIDMYIKNQELKICFQWIRPFSVYGYDDLNNSIFSKILKWDAEGEKTFPCTMGEERYDYIHMDEVVKQIEAIISQTTVSGAINCCTGRSVSLKDQIDYFINEHKLEIRPEYGAYARRKYDSDEIYGNRDKLNKIMEKYNAKN